jgi:alpha-1,2-mannosyltransferase
MTVMTPVSHVHYYAFVLPLVAGLWLQGLAERPGTISASRRVLAALIAWGLLTGLTMLPYEWARWSRDMGVGVLATVFLWAVGVTQLAHSAWVGVVPADSFDDSLPDVPGWGQPAAKRRPAA